MRFRQGGAASLLITSLLLLLILVVTLSSYKRVFYQIKRAQNEVLAQQQFWLTESVLECAFSIISIMKKIPDDLKQQCQAVGIDADTLTVSQTLPTTLTAQTNNSKKISKQLRLYNDRYAGIIQSRSDLVFNGDFFFTPDARQTNEEGEWLCKLVSYQANVWVNGQLSSNNLDNVTPPYSDFPADQTCADTHWTQSVFQSDISNDDGYDLFMDRFDVPRSKWKQLMYGGEFYQIPQGLPDIDSVLPPSTEIVDCGSKIAAAIEANHDLIWLYGSCDLKQSELDVVNIELAIEANSTIEGIIVVIQDGLFSTNSEQSLRALIYQIVTEPSAFTPSETLWSATEAHQLSPVPLGLDLSQLIFYQSNRFYAQAGYVLDAPNLTALFSADINGLFKGDLIDVPLSKIRETRWVIGSWRDF